MRHALTALTFTAALTAQTTWLPRPPTGLAAREGTVMAYDSLRQQTVLFGGLQNGSHQTDTWLYDGLTWRQQLGAGGPTNYFSTQPTLAAVFDSVRNVTVMTSSWDFSTWDFDGTQWNLRHTFSALQGLTSYAMAYDSVRQRVVLFGGYFGGQYGAVGISETWEWDGTTWAQVGTGGPHPRHDHMMAFDTQRGLTVLFGGMSNVGNGSNSGTYELGDTWEWNGSYWFEHFGIAGPPARHDASMTYDSRQQVTMLVGGFDAINPRNDTWHWDGSSWQQVTTTVSLPTGSNVRPLVFDSVRGVAIAYTYPSGATNTDVWEFLSTTPSQANYTAFGQGCAGPVGTPALAAASTSLPRLGSTFTVNFTNLPASPFNLPFGVFGFSASSWNGTPLPLSLDGYGFTGCQAWISPDLSTVLTNQGGAASWSLALPVAVDLVGLDFYQQCAVLAPGWNPGGVVFSNAGHGVIGSP